MKVYREVSLREFSFWAGARDRVEHLSHEELDLIEQILQELYPEGLSATELNDLFWFNDDMIASWLGYKTFEEIMERNE